jgi:hypothetical protein
MHPPPPDTGEPFTRRAYAAYLDLALANGYSFESFSRLPELLQRDERTVCFLRHDIDYDPGCVPPISAIEAERGVRATYFFQTACPFYRADDDKVATVIRDVLRAGHWLGLHFDATKTPDDERVLDEVDAAAAELESRFGAPVRAVSFHMPTHRPVRHLRLRGERINTYAPAFFDHVEYVSDSNQNWRGKDLGRILSEARPRLLQVLTHPVWWRDTYTPFLMLLEELAGRLGMDVGGDILTPEQRALLSNPAA